MGVASVGRIEIHRIHCSEETCMYLARQDLGSFEVITNIVSITITIITLISCIVIIIDVISIIIVVMIVVKIILMVIPMAKLVSPPAGILRRTSIELGSGTVSFDVSLLSDLTGQQRAIMTNLQVHICCFLCLGHTHSSCTVSESGGSQKGSPLAGHCDCNCTAQLQHLHAETCWQCLHAATTEQISQALLTSPPTGYRGHCRSFQQMNTYSLFLFV